MNKEDKALIIEELVEKFNKYNYFYITDASGLTVADVNEFRKMCFNRGIEYKVFKNTLIKKALSRVDHNYDAFVEQGVLKGFSGILFSEKTGNIPARIIQDFRKKAKGERPVLKGAAIDSDLFIGDDQLATLGSLKSKEELIGEIVSLLQSPAKNVISSLQSGKNKLTGIVKTLSEKKE